MKIAGSRHYIINTMHNCTLALGMALEIHSKRKIDAEGLQELVMVINTAAIQLKIICQRIVDCGETK